MAALWIASQIVVEQGSRDDQALVKLSLLGDGGADPTSPPWLRARLHLDSPALPQVLEAVAGRRRIKFRYTAVGKSKDTERLIDPYAMIHRQGAWYVAGHDHDRNALRHFKLSRITGKVSFATRSGGADFEIPEGFSPDKGTVTEPWIGEDEGVEVEVAFSPRIAWWAEQSLGLEPVGTWQGKGGDWTTVKISVADEEGFVSWVLGFGEDAVVRKPPRYRAAVVTRLEAAAKPRAKAKAKR
jgi:predicted DNA-binding transcriptional regulator YafY